MTFSKPTTPYQVNQDSLTVTLGKISLVPLIRFVISLCYSERFMKGNYSVEFGDKSTMKRSDESGFLRGQFRKETYARTKWNGPTINVGLISNWDAHLDFVSGYILENEWFLNQDLPDAEVEEIAAYHARDLFADPLWDEKGMMFHLYHSDYTPAVVGVYRGFMEAVLLREARNAAPVLLEPMVFRADSNLKSVKKQGLAPYLTQPLRYSPLSVMH